MVAAEIMISAGTGSICGDAFRPVWGLRLEPKSLTSGAERFYVSVSLIAGYLFSRDASRQKKHNQHVSHGASL